VLKADFGIERRLVGRKGEARGLFAELVHGAATRTRPEGGALPSLIERWVGDVAREATSGGAGAEEVTARLRELCRPLEDQVSGHDFATVLGRYYQGHLERNDELQGKALRWLQAGYRTRDEARRDLGVRTIIDDGSFHDHLKLFAAFARIAGHAGCLVCLDELVVISHRLNSKQARESNYEALLRIVNDSLQGRTSGLVFVFAAVDECFEDKRRGLLSHEALGSRLVESRFARDGLVDRSGPVLRLPSLTAEDCFVLLHRIREIHTQGEEPRLDDEGIEAFLSLQARRLGAEFHRTPREVIRDFVGLLRVLEQNPATTWKEVLEQTAASGGEAAAEKKRDDGDEDLASFRL
jgi:hypothetical protein